MILLVCDKPKTSCTLTIETFACAHLHTTAAVAQSLFNGSFTLTTDPINRFLEGPTNTG